MWATAYSVNLLCWGLQSLGGRSGESAAGYDFHWLCGCRLHCPSLTWLRPIIGKMLFLSPMVHHVNTLAHTTGWNLFILITVVKEVDWSDWSSPTAMCVREQSIGWCEIFSPNFPDFWPKKEISAKLLSMSRKKLTLASVSSSTIKGAWLKPWGAQVHRITFLRYIQD